LLSVVAGVFGLVIGSFLNVVIYRLPIMLQRDWRAQCREILAEDADAENANAGEQDEETFNLLTPRSRCPACDTPIKSHRNVPLVSYLLLKGKCAACGAAISSRYPLIEALTAVISALVAWRFGFTLECAGALALSWSLIALSVIDIDGKILPDIITLPLLWLGLLLNLIGDPVGSPLFVGPEAAIVGAIVGYLSLWSVYWAFKLIAKKEGMGYGDFKLLAALGAWMGWQMLLLIIILSAVVGLIFAIGMIVIRGHDRQVPIPFGPYLAIAGFVALMWGPEIIDAYKRLSGL
jgi:leader peptidase (prepilin peptidase)/N-methyltransferase